ncbi:ABC transporter substrate-binding protein [Streptomyces sp. NPDC004609]|uniref:bifunctional serine/threonine-protein kinase/ABC transporter substrate-binding protein n=1 Tax=Streptomyces sp. NPDC004609 TaxID=3364704 RepID=UPI003695E0B1
MQPLRPGDPSSVGGYRLVARLGAGGMGVVYLARSERGALAALKVIRAEHAADPRFRARFRRETQIARRIGGPWVVRVVGADAAAREPWLATEYVPGPSLSEAVAAHGPLPERTVRALGSRLAEALAGAHAEGLVHRDVKPGNVLLALDGPRLIDFGIARAAGATALTAGDAVIGSPGFLAPEQARVAGSGEVGPAGDVFSLGCVLAYAVTGRRPFGTGTAAAVIYRTVHEEPDLDGVPPGLLGPIRSCLAKSPADRPLPYAIRAALAEPQRDDIGPGGRGPGEPQPARPQPARPEPARPEPGEPGTGRPGTGRPGTGRPGTGEPGPGRSGFARSGRPGPREPRRREPAGDWLPDGLPALIAERSSRVLALPVPDPTVVVTPENPRTAPASRRRFLALGGAGAVAAAGGVAAWLGNRFFGDNFPGSDATSRSTGPRPRRVMAVATDLSGPNKADGRAQERGARLAAETFNARPDRSFDLVLKVFDDRGDPEKAMTLAGTLTADPSVLAVMGPTTRAISRAVMKTYDAGVLPVLTVSVGSRLFELSHRRSYFELRSNESQLVLPVSRYFMIGGTERVAVVDDMAGGEYSWSVVKLLKGAPPELGEVTTHPVAADSDDFASAVRAALAVRPDGVVYAGNSPARAALTARALRDSRYQGFRGAAEPAMGPRFLAEAGSAADGWVFGAGYVDPARMPGAKAREFLTAYRRRWRTDRAERHAVEAYDTVLFTAHGIQGLGADGITRGALVRRLRGMTYQGVAKTIAFQANTAEFLQDVGLFLYRVEGGRPRFLGQYETVKSTA